MWSLDDEFVEWLEEEGLGTDARPLDDDILELMHRAWLAAKVRSAKVLVARDIGTVNM